MFCYAFAIFCYALLCFAMFCRVCLSVCSCILTIDPAGWNNAVLIWVAQGQAAWDPPLSTDTI